MLTQQKHGTLNWWSTFTCDACWLVLTAAAERASISLAVAFRAARPPTVLPAAADTRRLTASRLDTSSDISRAYSPAWSAHARSHCDIQQSSNGPLSGTTRVSRYQNSVCPSVCLSVCLGALKMRERKRETGKRGTALLCWMDFCEILQRVAEVCPKHWTSHFGVDRPRGPTRGAENVQMYNIVSVLHWRRTFRL